MKINKVGNGWESPSLLWVIARASRDKANVRTNYEHLYANQYLIWL